MIIKREDFIKEEWGIFLWSITPELDFDEWENLGYSSQDFISVEFDINDKAEVINIKDIDKDNFIDNLSYMIEQLKDLAKDYRPEDIIHANNVLKKIVK
jgi:hypothetical protein